MPSLLPKTTPRLHEIIPDFILVLAAAASMLLTVLLFGVVPLAQALRRQTASLMGKAVTASRRTARISLTLIGVELALATPLLIGAGLMGRTLWQLASVDSGVQAAAVVAARISAGPSRCWNTERCLALLRSVDKTLLEIPGVQSVNWSNAAPLDQDIFAMAVDIQDHPKPPGAPAYVLWNAATTPGYFHALGIPLRAGRNFTAADQHATSPVMIVSASTALRFWPQESAVGKRIRPMAETKWRTIVGVVGDVAQYSLTGFPSWIDGVQYLPITQFLPRVASSFDLTIFIESTRPQGAIVFAEAVRHSFPDVVVSRVRSLDEIRSESVADQRSTAWLLALFAGLGLVLGVAGVYG